VTNHKPLPSDVVAIAAHGWVPLVTGWVQADGVDGPGPNPATQPWGLSSQ